MNARTGKAGEAADYIRAAMARSAPEFAPALYEEYDYVALLRASLDRDIEAQKEQNEAQSVIDELIRLRDAGEADGRHLQPGTARSATARRSPPAGSSRAAGMWTDGRPQTAT